MGILRPKMKPWDLGGNSKETNWFSLLRWEEGPMPLLLAAKVEELSVSCGRPSPQEDFFRLRCPLPKFAWEKSLFLALYKKRAPRMKKELKYTLLIPWWGPMLFLFRKKHKQKTTNFFFFTPFIDGLLGSCIDEERSELRKQMWLAISLWSLSLWTILRPGLALHGAWDWVPTGRTYETHLFF